MKRHTTFLSMLRDWAERGVIATVEYNSDAIWFSGPWAPHDREGANRFKKPLVAHLRGTNKIEAAIGDYCEPDKPTLPFIADGQAQSVATRKANLGREDKARCEKIRKAKSKPVVARGSNYSLAQRIDLSGVDWSLPVSQLCKELGASPNTIKRHRRLAQAVAAI